MTITRSISDEGRLWVVDSKIGALLAVPKIDESSGDAFGSDADDSVGEKFWDSSFDEGVELSIANFTSEHPNHQ